MQTKLIRKMQLAMIFSAALAFAMSGTVLPADAKLVELQTCYQGVDWPVTQVECIDGGYGEWLEPFVDLEFASFEDEEAATYADHYNYDTPQPVKSDRLSIPMNLEICHVTVEARGEGFSVFMRVPLEVCD